MLDDDPHGRPKRPVSHEIGSDLSSLSEHELAERIELLRQEIDRLSEERKRKAASREAASAFFRT